jgi:hypothetical protein
MNASDNDGIAELFDRHPKKTDTATAATTTVAAEPVTTGTGAETIGVDRCVGIKLKRKRAERDRKKALPKPAPKLPPAPPAPKLILEGARVRDVTDPQPEPRSTRRAQNSKIISFCARFFAPLIRVRFAVVQPNSSRTAHEIAPYRLPFKIRAAGRVPRRGGAPGGLGRTTIYDALGSGDLKSIKIGKRRLITIDWLRAWLLSHEADATGGRR